MDDLVAWLTRIWDEDEAIAERVPADQRSWTWTPNAKHPDYSGEVREIFLQACNSEDPQYVQFEAGQHIARHDPAAVLSRITADRKILAWCTERDQVYIGGFGFGRQDRSDPKNYVPGSLTHPADSVVIRLMAEAYDDRPGYCEEWRP